MNIDLRRLAALPDEQRKEAEELLAEYRHAHELNPLLRYNHPDSPRRHPKQLTFHAQRAKIKGLVGGNRSGKTAGGVVDDLIQLVDEDCLPAHLRPYKKWEPPTFGRIVAPKFNENIEQVIFPAIREWVPKAQLRDGSWESAFSKQRRILEFANGSTLQFLSFDQDLDSHSGAALHFCHFDEEPEGEKGLALFHENLARLVDYDGDFKMTWTPLFGLSWSYDVIWEHRLDPEIAIVQVDSTENPHINQQALAEFFASLSNEERQARKEGRFVHFSGLFYPEFSDDHLIEPPSPEHVREQTIVLGIDPGLNRTGVVWVAFDQDNTGLVFCELYPAQETVEEVARKIKAVNAAWGIQPAYAVIDPSARNRQTINAEAIESAYLRAGVPTIPGQNDRAAGIFEVKRRLQHKGLAVSRDCPTLIWEFGRYRKDPSSSDEFAAVKRDDHCFVAGTLIRTERGEVPVEDVKLADRVWTRDGYAPVIAAARTRTAPTRVLRLEDGRTLRGTDDHPVWVQGQGFRRLDALRYGDMVLTWPKSSSSTASASTATPILRTERTGSTTRRGLRIASRAWTTFTARFGRRTTGRSPTATTSTTATVTPSTTTSPTSSACRPQSTPPSIGPRSVQRHRATTRRRFDRSRKHGTARRKAVNGIVNTARRHGPSVSLFATSARNAERSSTPSSVATQTASARTHARRRGAAPAELTIKTAPALGVKRSSASTAMPGFRLVPVRVAGSSPAPSADVYALTVYGRPEYLANGVLVRNCLDALRYVLLGRAWNVPSGPASGHRSEWRPGHAPPADWLDRAGPASVPPLGSLT